MISAFRTSLRFLCKSCQHELSKNICMPFKSFIYVCLLNPKLNNIHRDLSYSKYAAHITADIKHHYTPSDHLVWLIFCKTDVSEHYRSSLQSSHIQKPHFLKSTFDILVCLPTETPSLTGSVCHSCFCCFHPIALLFCCLLFLTLIWGVFTSLSSALIPRWSSHSPCEPWDTGDGQVLSFLSSQSKRP